METCAYQKVLADYGDGTMDAKTAMNHGLQHIGKLYEAQKAANLDRRELRSKVSDFENKVKTLQNEVARLTALVEKLLSKRKASGKKRKSQPCA